MNVYVTQANFTTKRRFEIKNQRSFTEMNFQSSKVEKNTHEQKVQMQKFCSQTRLVGEIYSSDVIMHRGYSAKLFLDQFNAKNNRKLVSGQVLELLFSVVKREFNRRQCIVLHRGLDFWT